MNLFEHLEVLLELLGLLVLSVDVIQRLIVGWARFVNVAHVYESQLLLRTVTAGMLVGAAEGTWAYASGA